MTLLFGTPMGELRVLDHLATRGPVSEYVAYDPEGLQLVRMSLLDPGAELPLQLRFAFEAHLLRNTQSTRLERWVTGGNHEGSFFRAVRFERGRTLAGILETHERLGTRLATKVMRGIFEALDDLHGERLVGLSLAPEDVLVTEEGLVVARGIRTLAPLDPGGDGSRPLASHAEEWTPADGREGEAADLYRAGLLGWRLILGETTPPPASDPPDEWPEALQAILYRCLAGDPAARYGSATEALAAVEELLEGV